MLVLWLFVWKSQEKFDGCSKIISTTQCETDICVRQPKRRVSHAVLSVSVTELELARLQSVTSGQDLRQAASEKLDYSLEKKRKSIKS